jgi:hypothetical protein
MGLIGLRFAEELDGGGDGEAHDVEEVAFDTRDPAGGVALDAVGAGFVERVAGGKVVDEVVFRDGGKTLVVSTWERWVEDVTTARPVWTLWVRPERVRSMRSASARSVGLLRIWLSSTTVVSAPSTVALG